jgi:hypothetical protein
MLIGSLGTILATPASRLSWGALIVCRFLTGIAHVILIEDVIYKSKHCFIFLIYRELFGLQLVLCL